MTEFLERIKQLSPQRLTLLALELKGKLDAAQAAGSEPLAIVGMSCRFPGDADSPEAYWSLMEAGRDAIGEVPKDRWDNDAFFDPDPEAKGRVATRFGGFLSRIDLFDAALFGISPREALSMDPQQRLLLEVAWEALEDAGIAPDSLAGSLTGVFVGVCNSDYSQHIGRQGLAAFDLYRASGNAISVISGRLSYVLGFQGPAVSVDTACSSSLVSIHLACQSLWSGESRIALAGGVNVICSPETTVALSRAHMMAPDGRCKAFDSRADGFVRGEGCGLVVLKRLSDALTAGDRVRAVIRGSASNQDGRSSGLTAPNGPSQEAVIRAALAKGGVEPAEVDYIESHGTGTSLGDPIEARALGAVLRVGREPGRPVMVGSVKTNFGHLESAAGIAGLIKVVLALQMEAIPPHLHLRELSPHIDWPSLPLRIPTELTAWKRGARPRLGGVSSFGFSGTNAHVVLEEAPLQAQVPAAAPERPLHALALSGKTESALHATAARLAEHLEQHPQARLVDVAFTANTGRAHLTERAVVLAADAEEARTRLSALAQGGEAPGIVRGHSGTEAPRVAFLFTGQGAQAPGMGRSLYETQPTFRAAMDRCAEVAKAKLDRPLLDIVFGAPGSEGLIDRTGYTQPALFAVEWSLFELWRSWGVLPSAVLGHSLGELTAACVAGVFSVQEALSLVIERARLMESLPSFGSMASVFTDEARVQEAIAKNGGRLWIAALNAPDNVVVSGEEAALTGLLATFEAAGVNGKRLLISNAFHSPLVEPMLEPLVRAASSIVHRDPQLDLVSNLSGAVVRSGEINPAYWWRHVRDAVRFAPSLRTLADQGYRVFVELGPHPTLLNLAQGSLGTGTLYLPSLRRGADDWRTILESLGALHVRGVRVSWRGYDADYRRSKTTLPTYPFQRERYWIDAPPAPLDGAPVAGAAGRDTGHPLIGRRLPYALPTFEVALEAAALPLLREHRVFGVPLAAASVLVEMVRAAATDAGTQDAVVEDLVLREALSFPEEGSRLVQVALTPADADDGWHARVFSRAKGALDATAWTLHATARARASRFEALPPVCLNTARSADRETAPAAFHEALRHRGIELGPAFQGLQKLWRGEGDALGLVTGSGTPPGLGYDPGLLDACLQVLGAAAPGDWTKSDEDGTYLLAGLQRLRTVHPLPSRLLSRARLEPAGPDGSLRGEVLLCDDDGRVLGEITGVVLKRVRQEALRAAIHGETAVRDWFHELVWPAKALAGQHVASPDARHLPEPGALAARVAPRLLELARSHGLSFYDAALPRVDALAGAYVRCALAKLGWAPRKGQRFTAQTLAAELGVVPAHRRLLSRLLDALSDDGLLARRDGGFELAAPMEAGDPEGQRVALQAELPACAPEISLVGRCGAGLADVLRGTGDPLQLLFPDGSFATVEKLYQESPAAKAYNQALAQAVDAVVESLPAGRTLRILELGAGTGGSTSFVLPRLPRERTRYVFTDLSRLFMARAAEKFRDFPFVEYVLLDAERPLTEQGMPARSFDLVLASNVLHATRDLAETLKNTREALAPGGLLLLLEGTQPHAWVDLTFGLTEGWWRFRDAGLRPNYPLLGVDRWRRVLADVGFASVASVYGEQPGEGLGRQALLIAREAVTLQAAAVTTSASGPALVDGATLVLGDASGLGLALANQLKAAGGRVLHAVRGAEWREDAGRGEWALDPDRREDVQRLMAAARAQAKGGELRVAHLWGLDLPSIEAHPGASVLAAEVTAATAFVQVLSALAGDTGRGRLVIVTRGAQGVAPGQAMSPAQAVLWGLGRVAALEHPLHFGSLVDLDPAGAPDEARTLLDELRLSDGEDQVAFRGGTRQSARLRSRPTPRAAPVPWRADGRYLITGGLGGLGLSLARWLVDQGVKHLVLTSRRGLPPRASWAALAADGEVARQAAAVCALEERGAQVQVAAVDVADEDAMGALFVPGDGLHLRGVFHLAADMSSAPLCLTDAAGFAAMLRPKLAGALALHHLTASRDLDCFVLFSSTTALIGVAGLGHYAGANQFMDALAHHRRGRGLPALSINWGTWGTMRVASEQAQRQFREGGLLPMQTELAFDAMARLLDSGATQGVVARVDWRVLKAIYESRRPRPMLAELGTGSASPSTAPKAARAAEGPDLQRRYREASPAKRRDVVLAHVRGEAARIRGIDPARPMDLDQGLFEMGMDSLMSVELKSRLESAVGKTLPSTLTFNYPNIGALGDYLLREVLAAPEPAAAPASVLTPTRAVTADGRDLDDLSEDQLAAMLASRLGASGPKG